MIEQDGNQDIAWSLNTELRFRGKCKCLGWGYGGNGRSGDGLSDGRGWDGSNSFSGRRKRSECPAGQGRRSG